MINILVWNSFEDYFLQSCCLHGISWDNNGDEWGLNLFLSAEWIKNAPNRLKADWT